MAEPRLQAAISDSSLVSKCDISWTVQQDLNPFFSVTKCEIGSAFSLEVSNEEPTKRKGRLFSFIIIHGQRGRGV